MFGPDGMLYIGMGDGGSGGDPQNNGQNPGVLLGKLLRVDVDSNPSSVEPADGNPYTGNAAFNPLVWAYGLRNPWRFSFDRSSGLLYIADVGQNNYEEVDVSSQTDAGLNYGWNRMEGTHCYLSGCSQAGLVLPVLDYSHSEGCSITGGHVYRGSEMPSMRGRYFYSDYCAGWVRSFLYQNGVATDRREHPVGAIGNVTTYGEDAHGELYLGTAGGVVYKLTTPGAAQSPVVLSVVNPASWSTGAVAGSIATAFLSGIVAADGVVVAGADPLPKTLDGVSLTVNGNAAPLLAVARVNGLEQVNFQVPFEVAGADTVSVEARYGDTATVPFAVPLLSVQAAVFTANGQDAVVVHVDGNRLVTKDDPIVPGEYVYFYAVGLGAVSNTPSDGASGPVDPFAQTLLTPTVLIDDLPAELLFSGLAPSLFGIYQVNVRVPQGIPSGDGELVLHIGSASSPPLRVLVR